MTAAEASALIQARKLSCEELTRSCLARITARDPVVKVWLAGIPPMSSAARANWISCHGKGRCTASHRRVKDVIDSADYPTTQNSANYDEFEGRTRRRAHVRAATH